MYSFLKRRARTPLAPLALLPSDPRVCQPDTTEEPDTTAADPGTMGLITASLIGLTAFVTSPVWLPLVLAAIVFPHFVPFVVGGFAMLTAPVWIPLAIISDPVIIITSPIWGFLLLLAIIL